MRTLFYLNHRIEVAVILRGKLVLFPNVENVIKLSTLNKLKINKWINCLLAILQVGSTVLWWAIVFSKAKHRSFKDFRDKVIMYMYMYFCVSVCLSVCISMDALKYMCKFEYFVFAASFLHVSHSVEICNAVI